MGDTAVSVPSFVLKFHIVRSRSCVADCAVVHCHGLCQPMLTCRSSARALPGKSRCHRRRRRSMEGARHQLCSQLPAIGVFQSMSLARLTSGGVGYLLAQR